jgi:hypothetical protein
LLEQSELLPSGRSLRRITALHDAGSSLWSLTATMIATTAIVILAIGLAVLYTISSIRTYYSLKAFGGHWSAGWSRIWLLRTQSSGEMHKVFTDLNRKYGESHGTKKPRLRPLG